MSDWNDDEIDELLGDPSQDNNTIRTLRAKVKADNAAMKAMKAQLEELTKARTENVIESALSSAGLNPAYKKFYTGEADQAKVVAWIDENKELLGVASEQPPGTTTPQMPAGPTNVGDRAEPAITPDTQAAMQRMLGMNGVDGIPPSNYNDIFGKLSGAADEDAFKQALQQFGGPTY